MWIPGIIRYRPWCTPMAIESKGGFVERNDRPGVNLTMGGLQSVCSMAPQLMAIDSSGRIMMPFDDILTPKRNNRHFADDIFRCVFLRENVRVLIEISPKSVPMDPVDASLVNDKCHVTTSVQQVITQTNYEPVHIHLYPARGPNELTTKVLESNLCWYLHDSSINVNILQSRFWQDI